MEGRTAVRPYRALCGALSHPHANQTESVGLLRH